MREKGEQMMMIIGREKQLTVTGGRDVSVIFKGVVSMPFFITSHSLSIDKRYKRTEIDLESLMDCRVE